MIIIVSSFSLLHVKDGDDFSSDWLISWIGFSDTKGDIANECNIDGNIDSVNDGNDGAERDKRGGNGGSNDCDGSTSYVNVANNIMQISENT